MQLSEFKVIFHWIKHQILVSDSQLFLCSQWREWGTCGKIFILPSSDAFFAQAIEETSVSNTAEMPSFCMKKVKWDEIYFLC